MRELNNSQKSVRQLIAEKEWVIEAMLKPESPTDPGEKLKLYDLRLADPFNPLALKLADIEEALWQKMQQRRLCRMVMSEHERETLQFSIKE